MFGCVQYGEIIHNSWSCTTALPLERPPFFLYVFCNAWPLVNCKAVKVVEQPKIDWANPPAELIEDVVSKLRVVQLPGMSMDVSGFCFFILTDIFSTEYISIVHFIILLFFT